MKQADDADPLTASLDDDGKHSVASWESALHILPKGVVFRTIPERHIECNGCEITTHCDDIWFNGRIFPDYARLPAIWGFYTKNIKRFNFSEQPSGDFCARCAKMADRFYLSRAVVSAKLKGDEITFKEDWEENKESVNKDLKNNVRDGQGFQLSKLPRREISEKTKQFFDCKQDGFWLTIPQYNQREVGTPKENGHKVVSFTNPRTHKFEKHAFIPNDVDAPLTGSIGFASSTSDKTKLDDDSLKGTEKQIEKSKAAALTNIPKPGGMSAAEFMRLEKEKPVDDAASTIGEKSVVQDLDSFEVEDEDDDREYKEAMGSLATASPGVQKKRKVAGAGAPGTSRGSGISRAAATKRGRDESDALPPAKRALTPESLKEFEPAAPIGESTLAKDKGAVVATLKDLFSAKPDGPDIVLFGKVKQHCKQASDLLNEAARCSPANQRTSKPQQIKSVLTTLKAVLSPLQKKATLSPWSVLIEDMIKQLCFVMGHGITFGKYKGLPAKLDSELWLKLCAFVRFATDVMEGPSTKFNAE